jgi:hypothetical protein
MAVKLLTLSTGHVSLEFEPADLTRVAAAIRDRYGVAATQQFSPFTAKLAFGGCEFTFHDEWDEPCLISGSAEGDAILQALCAALNRS